VVAYGTSLVGQEFSRREIKMEHIKTTQRKKALYILAGETAVAIQFISSISKLK